MDNFIEIDVTDEIGPLFERLAANHKRSLKSIAKSLGWFLQKEIKKGVRSGSPAGSTFTERRPYGVRAALGGGSAAKQWYGRMTQAIGYQYDNGVLRIGWTSRTSAAYGRKQEFGFKTRVTNEIRKKFREAGFPLSKDTEYIVLPDRPFFEPMAGKLEPDIAPYVQNKLNERISENVMYSKKARRKYKVY